MSAFNFLRHVSYSWVSAARNKEANGCSPAAQVPTLPVLWGEAWVLLAGTKLAFIEQLKQS